MNAGSEEWSEEDCEEFIYHIKAKSVRYVLLPFFALYCPVLPCRAQTCSALLRSSCCVLQVENTGASVSERTESLEDYSDEDEEFIYHTKAKSVRYTTNRLQVASRK